MSSPFSERLLKNSLAWFEVLLIEYLAAMHATLWSYPQVLRTIYICDSQLEVRTAHNVSHTGDGNDIVSLKLSLSVSFQMASRGHFVLF